MLDDGDDNALAGSPKDATVAVAGFALVVGAVADGRAVFDERLFVVAGRASDGNTDWL